MNEKKVIIDFNNKAVLYPVFIKKMSIASLGVNEPTINIFKIPHTGNT